MRRALRPEVRDRVVFLGELNRVQIADELTRCSFFVAPSLRESYSYVCCEALAAGRAAIVSDQTGAAEVVGEAGITFPRGNVAALAQAMSRLWTDAAECGRLSSLAWRRARQALSGEAVVARRVAFYRDVIQNHASVAPVMPRSSSHRLAKIDGFDWMQKVMAALGKRDASTLRSLIREWGTVTTPGMRVADVLAQHAGQRKLAGGVRFHLYGAGRHTAKLLAEKSLWEAAGHRLVGLIDDHPRFKETPEVFGLPVKSSAAAAAEMDPAEAVILSTDAFEDQFWAQSEPLRVRGICVWRLYGQSGPNK
jgi:hypothetical protein